LDSIEPETLIFRSCRSLDGRSHQVDVGRRNGRPVLILHPDWTTPNLPSTTTHSEISTGFLELICINLTPLERLTWLQLLAGRSVRNIARDQGVSRAAIYIRIRGKDGKGGMAVKNPWVGAWWDRRQGTQRT
jgi:hypothetical protein